MGNVLRPATPETEKACLESTMKEADNTTLVVLHDYPPPDVSEPIYRVGEKLRVLSEEGSWWKVISVITGNENYIPSNHVAKVYHSWLFEGIVRLKAEELLQLPNNRIGSFMIRNSQTDSGQYSLSVKHRAVKHYRISRLPNNWYYISPRLTFQCLEDLVSHYSETADGLCCVLTSPCLTHNSIRNLNLTNQPPPVLMRRNRFTWDSVERSELMKDGTVGNWENDDSLLSFGLRNSIASYLSLSGDQEDNSNKSSRKKKSKSMYGVPRSAENNMILTEEGFSEEQAEQA
ncbi:Src-like-adapter [Acipenser ruthenus]|uniref:Src-like-adapter n=1 Tax=Acipenser ruthenus TaxID=7906 RepID=A0A662YYE6_ACIRT|nr:Src-like-adapter [Acipenser ruthenus]